MWVNPHSVGECPLFCPRDVPTPPASDCWQLFLVGEVFLQLEEAPVGSGNLSTQQLFRAWLSPTRLV